MPMFLVGYEYLLWMLPCIILTIVAETMVKSTFRKYSQVPTKARITGAEAAERILRQNGVTGIRIERVRGNLTDHYDHKNQCIRLSDGVYDSMSVAAVGVAAHEAGHAVQYSVSYLPIKLRSAVIPVTQFGSTLATPLLILGLVFSSLSLFFIGIICFGASLVFQLVTLPVEFNASRRAIESLRSKQILDEEELPQAKKVLRAAAMTYLAALAVNLAQLLRLLLIFRRGNSRR